jgi:hypothetical protein
MTAVMFVSLEPALSVLFIIDSASSKVKFKLINNRD